MTAAVAVTDRANGSVCTCSEDRAGALLRLGVRLTVGLLAVVAAVSSFGHMNELALRHGQTGWQSLVFPVCVDGVELVATLVLLLEHRQRGKATSLLAWFALAVGTAASVGANIAVGPPDLIGRAISGWPAVALIVSLKLLTMAVTMKPAVSPTCPAHAAGAVNARTDDSDRNLAGPLPMPVVSATPVGRPPAAADASSAGALLNGHAHPAASTPDDAPHQPAGDAGDRLVEAEAIPGDQGIGGGDLGEAPEERAGAGDAEDPLLTASRAIRDRLDGAGERLNRQKLLQLLRADGFTVSNERAGDILRALRVEQTHARKPSAAASDLDQ